jgi:hypothetical protein
VAVATSALLTVGVIAVAAPAFAADGDVTGGGDLNWGVKQSFRSYVSGTGGTISVADGAQRSADGASAGFLLPAASGTVADADNLTIRTTGSVDFNHTAHMFDVTLSNVAVVVDHGTASLVADSHLWAGTDFGVTKAGTYDSTAIDLADVANATVAVDPTAGTVTVSGTGVTLTEAGAKAIPLYSAGTALDDFTVTASYSTGDTEPPAEADGGKITVDVPTAAEPATGSLGWDWAASTPVDLGTATETSSGTFTAAGALNTVNVTDTRTGGTGSYGWSLSGAVSDFTSSAGSFSASHLGWTPRLVSPVAGVTAGSAADDLSSTQVLASSTSAASAQVKADLALEIPNSTPAGRYTATVTITAVG